MKKCPRCITIKPIDEFGRDRTRPDGRKAWCKLCSREELRIRRALDPQKHREYSRNWAERNPEKVRERSRRTDARRALKRHDGPGERARLLAEQDGRCFMCGRSFQAGEKIVVDHDHACCPSRGRTDSCKSCRRGLAHEWCNQIVGLCGEDMNVLRAIVANFEPARDAARARIAGGRSQQPELAL